MVTVDYIAGFIDADGSFTIVRSNKTKSSHPQYYAVMEITNTNEDVLRQMAKWIELKGSNPSIRGYDRNDISHINSRKIWKVVVTGYGLRHIIPELKEKLILKKAQAEVIEMFLATMDGSKLPVGQDVRDYRDSLVDNIQWLNAGQP